MSYTIQHCFSYQSLSAPSADPLAAKNQAEKVQKKLKGKDKAERCQRILEHAQKKEMHFTKRQIKYIKKALQCNEAHKGSTDAKEFAARLHALVIKKINQAITLEKCTPKALEGLTVEKFEKLAKSMEPYQVTALEPVMMSEDEVEAITAQYDEGEKIPEYVATFDTSHEHTLNVKKYIDVRVSHTIQDTAKDFQQKGKNVEVFIGSIKDIKKYYAAKGYYPVAQLNTNNSNKYLIFASSDKGKHKLVIAGVCNQSRYNNVLMQLKFMGVDLDKVSVHGSLCSAMAESTMELRKRLVLSIEGDAKPTLAFIGNRSIVFIELAKYLYPGKIKPEQSEEEQEKEAEKLLKKNAFKTSDINKVFKFSCALVDIRGRPSAIVAFRMPNGSLSGLATKEILDLGFRDLIMVGAGGSLDEDRGGGLGSMQVVESSSYQEKTLTLNKEQIIPIEEIDISGADVRTGCSNVTVDGPLEEDTVWQKKVKSEGRTSVDVETYHIFSAVSTCKRKDIRVLPGLFNSDVVGKHPLEDKITSNNAYSKFPALLHGIFKYEGVKQEGSMTGKK